MAGALRSSVPDVGVLVAGRYRIGHVIGKGGMGVVVEAWDELSGVAVAVKVLQSEGDESAERFFREARRVSKLESQHIVRVFDVGTFDGHPFMVMERLAGEDFGAKVRAARLLLNEVADCIVQACEALAHAHGAGIVHRDIKASNLFEHRVDRTPIVKVLDFGISKALAGGVNEPEHTLTRTRDGGFLGSPPYMSPEHIRNPRSVDARTDIWSLGVVAYRLLSSEFPFQGESTGELLVAILENSPPRLSALGVDVPEEVEAIIARCLARKREDRFADVGALAAAMAPFASARFRSYGEHVRRLVHDKGSRPVSSKKSWQRPIVSAEPGTETAPSEAGREPDTERSERSPAMGEKGSGATPSDVTTLPLAASSHIGQPIPPLVMPAAREKPRAHVIAPAIVVIVLLVGAGAWFVTGRLSGATPAAVTSAERPIVAAATSIPASATPAALPSPTEAAIPAATRPGSALDAGVALAKGSRGKPAARAPGAATPAAPPVEAPPPPPASAPRRARELEPNPYVE